MLSVCHQSCVSASGILSLGFGVCPLSLSLGQSSLISAGQLNERPGTAADAKRAETWCLALTGSRPILQSERPGKAKGGGG